MKKTLCDVYKSPRHEGMYLYVDREDGLSRVSEALLERLGQLEKALTFVLTPDRTLAKEDAATVLDNLIADGYHLQLPAFREDHLAEFRANQE